MIVTISLLESVFVEHTIRYDRRV